MDVPWVEYVVQEGDDYRTIAEAHDVWDWWDLVRFNEHVDPATGEFDPAYENPDAQDPGSYRNPDLLAPGDRIRIPVHDQGAAGRALLKEEAGCEPPEEAFGGRTYRSPWGTFSFTLQGGWSDLRQRFAPGTRFQFRQVDDQVVEFLDHRDEQWKTEGELDEFGGFEVELPRGSLLLFVQDDEGSWEELAPLDASRLRELRLQVPLPPGWHGDHQQLVIDHGADAAFPPAAGAFDPFRLGLGSAPPAKPTQGGTA
ncbi:MAG: hypothetical protein AB7N76_00405 [Planctomycetota bacterium]